jgi:hypothetical protein
MAMGSRREASIALVVWFCLLSLSLGQETKYWQWEAKKPFHDAIVFVRCRLSENSWSNGSGTIVAADEKNCWIVTASHIFQSNSAPEMSWDGKTWAVGRFLAKDDESDVAIVWQPTLMKAQSAPLAIESPKPGDVLSFAGYGGPGSQMRRWTASVRMETDDKKLVGDTSGLDGDSGGGVFNQQGQLVGVISGGRRLQSFGLVSDGKDFQLHYPLMCCNTKPIRSLFGRFRQRRNSTPQGIVVPQGE